MREEQSVAEQFVAYMHKLRQSIRVMWVVVGLALLLGGISIVVGQIQNSHRLDEFEDTTIALCLFRENLENQISDTEKFLAANPGVQEIVGVPLATILETLAARKKTALSLKILECD